MKKKIRFRSMTAIGTMLGVMLLVFWGVLMVLLTREEAYNFYDFLTMNAETFSEDIISYSVHQDMETDIIKREKEIPGIIEYHMIDTIMYANQEKIWQHRQHRGEDSSYDYPVQTAVIFYDKDENMLLQSGSYLYFQYLNEDEWTGNIETINSDRTERCGWIDLEKIDLPDSMNKDYSGGMISTDILRIRGKWDGNEIIPVQIDYCMMDGTDDWQEFAKCKSKVAEKDLVIIYAYWGNITYYNEGDSIEYEGTTYDNLLEYTDYFTKTPGVGLMDGMKSSLECVIRLGYYGFYDLTNPDVDPETDAPQIKMITATMGYPIQMAITKLTKLYIVTFVALFFVWCIMYRTIKGKIVIPLQEVNKGIADGYKYIPKKESYESLWKETKELREHFFETQDKLRMLQNEKNRLEMALNYSKKAEETRRQMTSNIAHELKTPLAIIHSYSEGLKEHIADDKKEEYYDVILSETERMDAIVLEMLDLSRLEAGKVKLSRDEFSLSFMVQSVFDVLSTLASGKRLNIELDMEEEFIVHADEGRIYQVVSNFVSNAIRYTPEGGVIKAKIHKRRQATIFTIENTSKHFTKEELEKIWDTFYRTDKSRNSKGTGLGLAIAKNIIKLHGGSCAVRNTEIGVEFKFLLLD